MRNFADDTGTEWTVFEVRRAGEEANWGYLPRGFRSGWLCFESARGKRRLSPVPEGWRTVSESELVGMLGRATAVGRARMSAADGVNVVRKSPDSEANP